MAIVKLEDAPQSVQTFYNKGVAAMERDNLGYAMDMFEAALGIEPRLLQLRKLLRAATIKQTQIHPPSKMAIAKGMADLMRFPLLLKKDAFQALERSEKWLRVDPLNLKFSRAQCDAAEKARLPEVAIQTLEILKDHRPANLGILEPLARLYFETEQFDREYECRTAIAHLNPNDSRARKKLKDAAARLAMGKTGWKKTERFREIRREENPADGQPNPLQTLQEKIDSDPENIPLRLALANEHLRNKQYTEAIHVLKKCTSSDPQIEQKLLMARELQLGFEIAESENTNNGKEASSLRKKLETMQIENAARQIERYPNDLQLKFDYGKLLFEKGSLTEAIQQFQLAQRNPQRRVRALFYLAQAFRAKGQIDIAREQLETALADLPVLDEIKKEILYELGLICETIGDSNKAQQYLKEIYAVDIGYRDVASKIENSFNA